MTKWKFLKFLKFIINNASDKYGQDYLSVDIDGVIIDILSIIENYKREKK